MPNPKIIVLTPVKNESWILQRFLSVCSHFADHILIIDQQSTDGSRDICRHYPKVHLIDNPGQDYDEATRQKALIEQARLLVDGPRILIALDADEILAATALASLGWQSLLQAAPGTVVYVEKPDLHVTPYSSIRYYDEYFPIAFVDDGSPHEGKVIHSPRVPIAKFGRRLYLHDVKVLHYARLNPAYRARQRYYAMLESILPSHKTLLTRRYVYGQRHDIPDQGSLSPTPEEWIRGWEDGGVDMTSITMQSPFWQSYESLRLFGKWGVNKFRFDDVWDFDWEACRLYGIEHGEPGLPDFEITGPPEYMRTSCRLFDAAYSFLKHSTKGIRL